MDTFSQNQSVVSPVEAQTPPNPQPEQPKMKPLQGLEWITGGILLGICFFSVVFFVLNYFNIVKLSSYISFLSFLPTQHSIVAEVNGQKIYSDELDQTKSFFSLLNTKNANDPVIKKGALDFLIETTLLEKEAKRRNIDVSSIINARYNGSISQYGSQNALEKAVKTDSATYKKYLKNQAIKDALKPLATQWKLIDYFSIRYLYDDNAPPKEKEYKDVVDKKIQEYYTKIKNGLDIREAIRQRCQDPEINFLPYDTNNKVYTTGFNGTTCREQIINVTINKDSNSIWGDTWLKEVFAKTKKDEISPIIDFKSKNIGMYFIVKELNEGGGIFFSMEELINSLKATSIIKIY